jgi:plastocyanin
MVDESDRRRKRDDPRIPPTDGGDATVGVRMVRRLTPTLAICIAATGVAVGGAITDWGKERPYQSAAPAAAATADGKATLTIQGFAFSPLTVAAGATVEVANRDGAPHSVTADDKSFDTKIVDGGGTATFVAPSQPGDYAIHCTVHSSMHGTVTVT